MAGLTAGPLGHAALAGRLSPRFESIHGMMYSAMRDRALLIVAAALTAGSGCAKDAAEKAALGVGEPESLQYAPALNVHLDRMTKTPSGLYYLDREVGAGAVAERGKRASFSYVGTMPDGRIFDQSQPGAPYQLVVGNKEVIDGMDEGLLGMKVGGKRLLVIRPSLAYGNASPGAGIPANATLVFEITLDQVQ